VQVTWRTEGGLPSVFVDRSLLRDAVSNFVLNAVEAHYGQRPIIYTTVDFYRDNEMWSMGGTEFWLRSVAANPKDVYAGQAWTLWQYTSTGVVPGIAGSVDVNVFNGSRADWSDWLSRRVQ
jgi:lysozyme